MERPWKAIKGPWKAIERPLERSVARLNDYSHLQHGCFVHLSVRVMLWRVPGSGPAAKHLLDPGLLHPSAWLKQAATQRCVMPWLVMSSSLGMMRHGLAQRCVVGPLMAIYMRASSRFGSKSSLLNASIVRSLACSSPLIATSILSAASLLIATNGVHPHLG